MTNSLFEKINSITLVGASAGSGKTHRLSTEFVSALLGSTASAPVYPANILATTFTNKAADELLDRVRSKLLSSGELENSLLVPTGYIGTVNSVCGQLIQEFCFEDGLSPLLSVLPAERVRSIFSKATISAIDSIPEEAEQAASRLSLTDWYDAVSKITTLARINGISSCSLQESAEKSWISVKAILPDYNGACAEELDLALSDSLDRATCSLETSPDDTKKTKDALQLLKGKSSILKARKDLSWSDWAQLAKLSTGKASQEIAKCVIDAAAMHPYHPRLHNDIQTYLGALFTCASTALNEYESYKRLHAFIDFSDQEYMVLKLLDLPEIQAQIKRRIEVALIDEFQDTSPVQLTIFLKLAGLVNRSIWVGDEKQAIYGFRGTDSSLMQALSTLGAGQLKRDQLTKNFRSRPELVAFTNDVFSAAFPSQGISPYNVLIEESHRVIDSSLDNPLRTWWLSGKSWDEALKSLAFSVEKLMRTPALNVVDASTKQPRKIRPSDLAILCRSNDRCIALSTGLTKQGLKVACRRQGLLQTPECVLAFAALRFLVDKHDSLAAAEITHLTASESNVDEWLEHWIRNEADQVTSTHPTLKLLTDERKRLLHLTPLESLELAISAARIIETIQRWPGSRERLANLDSMRGLAKSYEELCLARRAAATPSGFISFLFKEVLNGGEQAPASNENAINVLTYHGAKGLEWPMVILLDLDTPSESNPFGTYVETDSGQLDLADPLKGRWIRCWPWPYGLQRTGVFLDTAAQSTQEMEIARQKEQAESVRLLYVGMTRARDYLVFACRQTGESCGWLDILGSSDDVPLLQFPETSGIHPITVNGGIHNFIVEEQLPSEDTTNTLEPTPESLRSFAATAGDSVQLLPYRLVPSKSNHAKTESLSIPPQAKLIRIGSRLAIPGKPDMETLGEVMHRFLAADTLIDEIDFEQRMALAKRLCHRWNIFEVQAADFVEASDRFHKFTKTRYPGAKSWREIGINGRFDLQRSIGRIDLLIECANCFVVVDHKTFPGRFKTWVKKAVGYGPQLSIYAELVQKATGKWVSSILIHMPIVGCILEI